MTAPLNEEQILTAMRVMGKASADKLNETILKIVRDSWPNPAARGGPFRCADGMCGADDCVRCHPTPYSKYEESCTEGEA